MVGRRGRSSIGADSACFFLCFPGMSRLAVAGAAPRAPGGIHGLNYLAGRPLQRRTFRNLRELKATPTCAPRPPLMAVHFGARPAAANVSRFRPIALCFWFGFRDRYGTRAARLPALVVPHAVGILPERLLHHRCFARANTKNCGALSTVFPPFENLIRSSTCDSARNRGRPRPFPQRIRFDHMRRHARCLESRAGHARRGELLVP